MYGWATDANITQASIPGTPVAPDATYPRKDIYFIRVNDSSAGDGSGLKSAPVEYLAGTPNASPVAPALPARSFLVATVTVPQAGAGSPTVLVNPARFVAAGGTLPVFSQAEQDALVPFDGFRVQRLDLAGRPTYTHNGTSYITPIENIAFTPEAGYSFTGSLTKVTGTTGSTAQLIGKITRNSGGDGPLLGTTWARVMTTFLPASVVPAAGFPADCVANLSTGVMGDGNPNIVAHVNVSLRSDRNLWARLDAGSYTWPLNGYLYVNIAWPL
jgi:hypothetical protein